MTAFERGRFDVILMDVQMPEMDGFEATVLIRAKELHQGGHVTIIAMTAHAMKGDREECLHSGMDNYVTKPIRWHELREALERVARENARPSDCDASVSKILMPDPNLVAPTLAKNSAVQTPRPTLPQPLGEPQKWQLDWIEALRGVNGDRELLRLVLGELVKEWPRLVAELQSAALAGDAVSLRRAAHTIRGSLRLFGSSATVDLAEQIETLAHSGKANEVCHLLPPFQVQASAALEEIERRLAIWKCD